MTELHEIQTYYENQTRTFGRAEITRDHRRIARVITTVTGLSGVRCDALELGCGNGAVAAVLVDQGMVVTALDFNAPAVQIAKTFESTRRGRLIPMQADFYTVVLPGQFDLIYYWDGFGVGTDKDQVKLLSRVKDWLAPDGIAVIDVFNPYYWSQQHGSSNVYEAPDGEKWKRQLAFDFQECRMVDCWTSLDNPAAETRSQSLRCYSPADFSVLLSSTGLAIRDLFTSDGLKITKGGTSALRERTSFLAVLEDCMVSS